MVVRNLLFSELKIAKKSSLPRDLACQHIGHCSSLNFCVILQG
jgi:hypothetical protein